MNGKARIALTALWCGLSWTAGAQGIIRRAPGVVLNGGQVLLQGNANAFGWQYAAPNGKPERMPEPRGDVLQFLDGSILHGKLSSMDAGEGLTWTAPEAVRPIAFHPNRLDFLRFAHAHPVSMTPSCHVTFANGDDLYGAITSLDDQTVGLSTWFGGSLMIPRAAVRTVTFLPPGYSVVYEGPYDFGGWMVVNNQSWTYRDGAFVGSGTGTLGRDVNLTNSATLEFDLSWSIAFNLEVGVFCDVVDHLEPNGGTCLLNISPQQISLRQAQNIGMFSAGGTPLPEGTAKDRMHVAIECDRNEGTASVYVDHHLVKTWKDCSFAGGGTGVLFMQNVMFSTSTLKISHVKISQWEDRGEPESMDVGTNLDAVHFVNHDRGAGKIEGIKDGKVKLSLSGTSLDIPLDRITQIEFAQTNAPADSPGPWAVRAHFPGGGSISFQLKSWDSKTVAGQSAVFGALAFQPDAIRELEFNLNHAKEQASIANTKEFEELDE